MHRALSFASILLLWACGSSSPATTTGTGGATSTGTTTTSTGGAGGAGATSTSSTGGSGGGVTAPMADIHFYGRMDTTDPARPKFAWPGSAIATRFTGTGITVHLDDQGDNDFEVVIDHGTPTKIHMNQGQDYVLAQGLPDGEHDVWIEKVTESFQGAVQFLGFTPDSGKPLVMTADPYADRMIEFIGDSITCGYGDECSDPTVHFTADTENEYFAWGAVAARTLGAGHAGISYSGIGVYRNYGGDMTNTMHVRYERTFADDPSSTWGFVWSPRVVVVNLGTNDFSAGNPGQPYVDAYTKLVTQVRGHYAGAFILLAVGSMLSEPNHTTALGYANAVVAARKAAGDANLGVVDVGIQDGNADGLGCDYHPSIATHQKMADELVPAIKAVTGW